MWEGGYPEPTLFLNAKRRCCLILAVILVFAVTFFMNLNRSAFNPVDENTPSIVKSLINDESVFMFCLAGTALVFSYLLVNKYDMNLPGVSQLGWFILGCLTFMSILIAASLVRYAQLGLAFYDILDQRKIIIDAAFSLFFVGASIYQLIGWQIDRQAWKRFNQIITHEYQHASPYTFGAYVHYIEDKL